MCQDFKGDSPFNGARCPPEHPDLVDQVEDLSEIVADEDQRNAALLQAANDVSDLIARSLVTDR